MRLIGMKLSIGFNAPHVKCGFCDTFTHTHTQTHNVRLQIYQIVPIYLDSFFFHLILLEWKNGKRNDRIQRFGLKMELCWYVSIALIALSVRQHAKIEISRLRDWLSKITQVNITTYVAIPHAPKHKRL